MPLPSHAAEWKERAEIDYIGPFVKAWAAFNAWYRVASGKDRERDRLEYVKSDPNPVRRGILPLLGNNNTTAEAKNFKNAVCDLHRSLDAIHFEVKPKGVKELISLRAVCIRPNPLQQKQVKYRNHEFKVAKVKGVGIEITVESVKTNKVKFQHQQRHYDPDDIYTLSDFSTLSSFQQKKLHQLYDEVNPRPKTDLVQGEGPALTIEEGMQFQCTPEHLFFGLVEVIYEMRNALLHGEVAPDSQVLACYEPAYRIVMQFLDCAR